jgi:alanyl aminopeptidase
MSAVPVRLLGWIFCPALLFAADAVPPQFLLPATVRPLRYELDLRIVPREPAFDGTARIDLILTERTDFLWLHGRDLTVRGAYLHAGGARSSLRFAAAGAEFIGLRLPTPAGPGPAKLEIEYTGKLNEADNVGVFRRRLGGDWYVFTTFTPIEARRGFPCFDEPSYKTPWQLTLHVERNQLAAGNTAVVSETDEPAGMKKVAFASTRPLPSELVAFAVGPFDVVDAGTAGQKHVPVRILVPRGRRDEARAASLATPAILARLEQYTGIPYPWDKLDHVALVGSAYGATENPGLITYQDNLLLARPERDTPGRQRAMRGAMAHELAHQWFGNLVTQASWTDVWLSEGFATWMEAKIDDLELPPFARGVGTAAARSRTMAVDDSAQSRPVRLAMHSREEMKDVYNRIVYRKGEMILTMLEHWLGPAAFKRALQRYLREHSFATATTDDLASALQLEAGKDVAPVLHGLLDRAGVPVVGARIDCTRVSLETPAPALPVCLRWEGGGRCVVLAPGQTQFQTGSQSCPAWVWTNASGTGYYRSLLTPEALGAIVRSGYDQLTAPERLALADDLGAMVAGGRFPAAAAMSFLGRMAVDREPNVVLAALRIAASLSTVIPADLRQKYAAWLQTVFDVKTPRPEQGESVREFFTDKKPEQPRPRR